MGAVSAEKVWMKYYSEESRNAQLPRMKVYTYYKEVNKDRLHDTTIYYYGAKITVKKFIERIDECANAFAALGVKKGDTVSLLSASTPESIAALYALNKIGATLNAIDPRMDVKSISRMIRNSGSSVLIAIDIAYDKVAKILPEIKQKHIIIQSAGTSLPMIKKIALKIAVRSSIPYGKCGIMSWETFIKGAKNAVAEEAPTFYPARDMKTLLSKLLSLAVADQQVTINMAEYITLPSLDESERTPWSDDELRVIWTAYDDEDVVAAYLLLMIYTGMMPGELVKCTKKMVRLDQQQIIGAGLKTNVRKQTPIVIADLVVPVLQRILTYTPDGEDQHILYTDRASFYDAYHDFTKARGIRDLPMYSCRHTTATALAVGTDVAPSIIQKIMRHAKFTTTQRYIHPDASDALSGVNKLSRKS